MFSRMFKLLFFFFFHGNWLSSSKKCILPNVASTTCNFEARYGLLEYCLICSLAGRTGGVQSQHKPCEQLSEEGSPSECALAAVWLSVLLLYSGL